MPTPMNRGLKQAIGSASIILSGEIEEERGWCQKGFDG
jgi:hypothetical protein